MCNPITSGRLPVTHSCHGSVVREYRTKYKLEVLLFSSQARSLMAPFQCLANNLMEQVILSGVEKNARALIKTSVAEMLPDSLSLVLGLRFYWKLRKRCAKLVPMSLRTPCYLKSGTPSSSPPPALHRSPCCCPCPRKWSPGSK